MQQRSDDRLVAYLDGELEMAQRREVEAWLDADPAARRRMAALAESAHLLHLAFDEVMREPVPDRLIIAMRPPSTGLLVLPVYGAAAPETCWHLPTVEWWPPRPLWPVDARGSGRGSCARCGCGCRSGRAGRGGRRGQAAHTPPAARVPAVTTTPAQLPDADERRRRW